MLDGTQGTIFLELRAHTLFLELRVQYSWNSGYNIPGTQDTIFLELRVQYSWNSGYNVPGTQVTMFLELRVQCSWNSGHNVPGTQGTMFLELRVQCSWNSGYNIPGTQGKVPQNSPGNVSGTQDTYQWCNFQGTAVQRATGLSIGDHWLVHWGMEAKGTEVNTTQELSWTR